MRYVVDNGIKWRAMPADFPPWPRVYAFFARWCAAVVDSQSVKADATVVHGSRGWPGRRPTDASGACSPTPSGSCWTCWSRPRPRPTGTRPHPAARGNADFRRLSKIWAAGGHRGHLQDWAGQHLGLVLEVVRRSDDVRGFQALPRRWVVERSFAWLLRSRRLVRDYERRTDSSEAVIRWSMIALMNGRLGAARQRQHPGSAPMPAA